VLEKKEQIFSKELENMMKQFETLEKEKEESQEMANLFESNLKELEFKIDQKNDEFDDVLIQLIRKEKEIQLMQDKIQERNDLEDKVNDLEEMNDLMLKEKIQLKMKLEQIGSTIRLFEKKKEKVERISVQCLTPRRSKRKTTMKLKAQQEEIRRERELRGEILNMLNQKQDTNSQCSFVWRKSLTDHNLSQLSGQDVLKSFEVQTPFKITFKQLETLESGEMEKGCLTERSSNRISQKREKQLLGKKGKENGKWAKMQSTPFDSNLKSVTKKPNLMLSSDIFEEEQFDVPSQLKNYFAVRKSTKCRTPQHHSRKSSLFNKNKLQRFTSRITEDPMDQTKEIPVVCDPEKSLESSSIQEYLSGNNLHFPMMQIPSLISPKTIPMKFLAKNKHRQNRKSTMETGNRNSNKSESKVPALDFSALSKMKQNAPKESVNKLETCETEDFGNDKSEWMSRMNESEIMIGNYQETEKSMYDFNGSKFFI
jgi:hypothetical protein